MLDEVQTISILPHTTTFCAIGPLPERYLSVYSRTCRGEEWITASCESLEPTIYDTETFNP